MLDSSGVFGANLESLSTYYLLVISIFPVISDNSVVISFFCFSLFTSLRSRRLEVVGERENGRVRGRHARVSFSRAVFFSCPLLPSYAGYLFTDNQYEL